MPQRPRTAPVRIDDEVELAIEAFADGPDAIARIDGYVVLVPGALPGERVAVRITSAARKFGRGVVTRVLAASPDRVDAACPHFLRCGGCHLQHVAHPRQLELARERLQKALAHALGDAAPPVTATAAPPSPWGQRHKVVLHLRGRGLRLAGCLHPLRERDLIAIGDCPAADPGAFDLALTVVALLARTDLEAWDERFRPEGVLRSIVVRRAAASGESHVVLVTHGAARIPEPVLDAIQREGATSVSVNANDGPAARLLGPRTRVLRGPPRIRETILGTDYLISPDAFFQTAPAGAALAVERVLGWLAPGERDTVADLFCGGGLFALPLAKRARAVVGIELSPVALGDARASAEAQGIANLRLERGHVAAVLGGWRKRGLPRFELAVLDPPRGGCGAETAQHLAALRPRRAAYVSCDPDALAADLAAFAAAGLPAREVVPIDMFPQTCHVEAIALLGG